jgi:DNA-binding transcriptional LysR family regulator
MKWTNSTAARVKMRDLQILLVVAKAGGIGKAASELAISQPAISKAISDLEYDLKVRLFDRTTNGVEVTPHGEVFLQTARAIFDDLRQGIKALEFLTEPTSGHVRLGTSPPLAAGFVPAVIERLARSHSRFNYDLIQADLATLHAALRDRTIDLAIAPSTGVLPQDDMDATILFHDRHVPVAGARSKWTRRQKLSWSEVLEEPWVLPPANIALWSYLAQAFQEAGIEPPRASVATVSIPAHYYLLATGRFLSMLPISSLHFAAGHDTIKALRLASPVKPSPVFVITLKKRTVSPAAKVFIETAQAFSGHMR